MSQVINDLKEECEAEISSILFAKQNIIHPSVITPLSLREELSKIKFNTNIEFPISPVDIENFYKYFSICDITVSYDGQILIYAIKIPIVNEKIYTLYNLIPLPVRKDNSSIYSYIDPSFPYLLLSTSKTDYCRFKNLTSCKKLAEEEYLCSQMVVHLTSQRPVCETLLRVTPSSTVPEDCPTKVVKAHLELWQPLSSNSWLFIMTEPTMASISCEQNSNIIDVQLNNIGILKLQQKCKCYTFSTVLYATSGNTANHTNFIPNIDLTDDCCVKQREFLNEDFNEIEDDVVFGESGAKSDHVCVQHDSDDTEEENNQNLAMNMEQKKDKATPYAPSERIKPAGMGVQEYTSARSSCCNCSEMREAPLRRLEVTGLGFPY
ncbi:uncharacterized protein LOC112904924 [Agrilus planipennis]|uniref:Uncharacterized protein LOC112904924 n=1 Tax=Agrilus planipennis TaxID=224129 RepID=A0A7F5R7M7_AGRPL|nr:uncharacterized protein LOC112904924 [Agrilus planipennis]